MVSFTSKWLRRWLMMLVELQAIATRYWRRSGYRWWVGSLGLLGWRQKEDFSWLQLTSNAEEWSSRPGAGFVAVGRASGCC